MRRFILWIIAILITFALGVGIDGVVGRLTANELPAAVAVEPFSLNIFDPPVDLGLSALPPPPTPPLTAEPNLILDYDADNFSLFEVFYIMDPPKEFTEIEFIEAAVDRNGANSSGSISVFTNKDGEYGNAPATFALVTDQRLFFATSELSDSNVAYRFDGEFLRKDFESVAGKNKAVLRGTLTKMENGRTIAQRTVSLRL